MAKRYKKYSLAEKRKYWGDTMNNLFDIQVGKNGRKRTKQEERKFLYAQGFYSASKSGKLSSKFNDMETPQQFGQIAGFKARAYDRNRLQTAIQIASINAKKINKGK